MKKIEPKINSIAWHEKRLNQLGAFQCVRYNSIRINTGLLKDMEKQIESDKRLFKKYKKEEEFYKLQIETAKKENLHYFDLNEYLIKKKGCTYSGI